MTKQEIVKKVVLEVSKEFKVSEYDVLQGIVKGNTTMKKSLNSKLNGYL